MAAREFLFLNFYFFPQPSCVSHPSILLQQVHKNISHIIESCSKADQRAQEELYRFCYPQMLKVTLRYAFGDYDMAGTLYNSAMLKIFRNISDFRHEGEFMAWVRKIVVNTCIDHCRLKTKFHTVEMNDTQEYMFQVFPDVYNKLSADDIMAYVHELPKNTGIVFNLFVIDGYKHEEIARILGIAAGTSKWYLNEARRMLKEMIEMELKKKSFKHVI
jgi:RNA polymerase sigma-70 factor (ECF subfamily)